MTERVHGRKYEGGIDIDEISIDDFLAISGLREYAVANSWMVELWEHRGLVLDGSNRIVQMCECPSVFFSILLHTRPAQPIEGLNHTYWRFMPQFGEPRNARLEYRNDHCLANKVADRLFISSVVEQKWLMKSYYPSPG